MECGEFDEALDCLKRIYTENTGEPGEAYPVRQEIDFTSVYKYRAYIGSGVIFIHVRFPGEESYRERGAVQRSQHTVKTFIAQYEVGQDAQGPQKFTVRDMAPD